MRKFAVILVLSVIIPLSAFPEITLGYCLDKAMENYPLIKKYGIVEKTSALSLSDINRSWFPRVGVYAQATVQNVVPEFPQALKDVLVQLGQEAEGLGHMQYKAGVDLSQTIWDGGVSKAQRNIERASASERKAELDVRMYAVREKVMDLYFGILLMDEQTAQTENTISLLKANLSLMESMLRGGVAMQSDVDMLQAQLLTMSQQLVSARSAVGAYRDVLSVYVGENLDNKTLLKPDATVPALLESARPELRLFEARQRLNAVRYNAVEASVMPRVGFFAQAYYGYPGINYFKSMVDRSLSFNMLAGVRIAWNIDSFYTKDNSRRKLSLSCDDILADRDIFLFSTRMQTASQTEEIEGIRAVMADDERIVALRGSVRRAAESQLKNGIIDATALLSKITDENQARLAASYHEIQLIQSIYKLKNTLNR